MVDRRGGCGQICAIEQISSRHFDFGVYPARFIDICSFLDWLYHAGEPHGRSMVFVFFESFRVLRGLSSSCLVLLSLPRFLLSLRKLRRRRTTHCTLRPSRAQLRSHRNIQRNPPITPGLRAPPPAVITPPAIRPRRIQAKKAIRNTGVAPARERRRVRDATITMSPPRSWRGPTSCTMHLSHPPNCGPWRSS